MRAAARAAPPPLHPYERRGDRGPPFESAANAAAQPVCAPLCCPPVVPSAGTPAFEDSSGAGAGVEAADLAELDADSYGRKYIEKKLSPTEQLAVEFLGSARARSIVENVTIRPASSIDRLVRMVEQALAPMMLFNDPKGSYAHCFCVFE